VEGHVIVSPHSSVLNSPVVAVDIGNTRMKWGRCGHDGVEAVASLPADEPEVWSELLAGWGFTERVHWAVASVHPGRRAAFLSWARERGDDADVLVHHSQLPLEVHVEHPERVGIDRLLNAVAANALREPARAAVIIDAGTAVTVDAVDGNGAFRGGFILPGLWLMAQALHYYTALLPLVNDFRSVTPIPPLNTEDAIRAGVRESLAGGIMHLIGLLAKQLGNDQPTDNFLTGGDAATLLPALGERPPMHVPSLTLEGIRLAARAP
jgi:type III pantothenate kinase